ncbi:PIN domain-containing protein [Syntrophomonas wolfei]|jgi:predicted nucleic acid-binding protein|uniref:Twitching motility protein PilT n=1 Tax=Syntrophomonas wolfei TaxID=863 RepID=A0A354YUQ9_9FIRM|nr:PIN domain-containing protein [Syntrophomonas wolfei]HBK53103.1 twitching motility protein PilT [Syntrophomonas wolfei]
MKIYFDMNIYNRVFDDQTQMRIRFESMAIDILFELVEKGDYELVWSFILEYENNRNPFIERKPYIRQISTLCKETIKPDDEIRLIAKEIVKGSNTKDKDALHLASAVYSDCDYFITCDDQFIRTVEKNRNSLKDAIGNIKLYNPVDFLRKEMDINVIE